MINTTSEIGHHGCTLVCRRIGELSAEAGIEIVSWLPLRTRAERIDWAQFDVVLVNGEGTLHHDRAGARRLANFGPTLRNARIPAYLINTVYQANSPDIAEGVGAYRKIWVRESLSAAELADIGIDCTVIPDLSLTWSGDVPASRGKQLVILDAVDDNDASELFQLAERHNALFYSIMTRPPEIATFPDKNRKRIAKYRWRRTLAHLRPSSAARAKWLNQFPSFESFTESLTKEAALIVTGRLHAMCVAFDLEIPVMVLPSNTHKIEGLLKDAGLESRVIHDASALEVSLQKHALADYAYTEQELSLIRTYRNRALIEARTMFHEIAGETRG